MARTHCDHCNAIVTPGAPFCLACFLPFEDEVPTVASVPAAVGASPTAPPTTAPLPDDFFGAPPTHPGQHVDWRATAPTAALLAPGPKRRNPTGLVVGAVVLVLALVGAYAGARALFSQPSEKETFATAFREGRPPDFLPSLPDLGSFRGSEPENPGDAQAFVQAIDDRIKAGNAELLRLQETLARWADGKASDDDVRAGIAALEQSFDSLDTDALLADAPSSTQRGLAKLSEATVGYRLALGALQDWMDSGTGGAKLTFRLSVGAANVDWDTGVVNLYRAAKLTPPPLPHPQPED